MFTLHSTCSQQRHDPSPRRSAGRARLLGAGLAMTVGATGVGAYTSGVAFASPSKDTTATARQGAPLDYPVQLSLRGFDGLSATFTPDGTPTCATNVFSGTVRNLSGTAQTISAFTASTGGSCGWRPTSANWTVKLDGKLGFVSVQQVCPSCISRPAAVRSSAVRTSPSATPLSGSSHIPGLIDAVPRTVEVRRCSCVWTSPLVGVERPAPGSLNGSRVRTPRTPLRHEGRRRADGVTG